MDGRLTEISYSEALRYLRYRGGAVPEDIRAAMERCEAQLRQTAHPRVVWRLFDLLPDGTLAGTAFRPQGAQIRALLRPCRQVILMAATLGAEAESLLLRAQSRSMADAVLLDALGSAAIENVCDNLCSELARSVAPRYLTARYSPGYGDLPLAQQRQLFDALDVTRRIGVTLTDSGLMTPQKSVTALIGVADTPQDRRQGCAGCDRYDDCEYRKEGASCGNR